MQIERCNNFTKLKWKIISLKTKMQKCMNYKSPLILTCLLVTAGVWNYKKLRVYYDSSKNTNSDHLSAYAQSRIKRSHFKHMIQAPQSSNKHWICSPHDRIMKLHHGCHKHRKAIQNSNIEFGKQFIVDDKKKVIYCQVPHVGSNSLKSILFNSSKSDDKQNQFIDLTATNNVTQIGLRHMQKLQPHYSNYTKFLVVRNPFDRILSIYNSIVNFASKTTNPAVEDYIRHMTSDSSAKSEGLSFEKFTQFLTDKFTPEHLYNNPHWRSVAETCFPCHIKYNRVIKLETMQSNIDIHFLQHLKLLARVNMPHLKKTRHKNYIQNEGGWKSLPEYGTISSQTIAKLLERYRLDMDIFGYSFDVKENLAHCKGTMSHKSKSKCC